MYRSDFEMIARSVKGVMNEFAGIESVEIAVERLAYDLADSFGEDNPRFDAVKFLKACGVQEPVVAEGAA